MRNLLFVLPFLCALSTPSARAQSEANAPLELFKIVENEDYYNPADYNYYYAILPDSTWLGFIYVTDTEVVTVRTDTGDKTTTQSRPSLRLNSIIGKSDTLNIPGRYVIDGREVVLGHVTIRSSDTNSALSFEKPLKKLVLPEGVEVCSIFTYDKGMESLSCLVLPASLQTLYFRTDYSPLTDLYFYSVRPPVFVVPNRNLEIRDALPNAVFHIPEVGKTEYMEKFNLPEERIEPMQDIVQNYAVRSGWAGDTIQSTQWMDENLQLYVPHWFFSNGFYPTHQYDDSYGYGTYGDQTVAFPVRLTVAAEAPVKIGKFVLDQDCHTWHYPLWNRRYTEYFKPCPSTAIFESAMEASEVEMFYELDTRNVNLNTSVKQFFVSFPFDVKVSDLIYTPQNKVDVAWYAYDGAARARAAGHGWVRMTADSILHAYRGYLVCFYAALGKTNLQSMNLQLKAMDNQNKNLIFATGDVDVPLEKHPATSPQRQNWNLVGNPYPCYFDTHYLDATTPIMILEMVHYKDVFDRARWKDTYVAYSPLDDHYMLLPNQAFHVQCPDGADALRFLAVGRQHNDTVRVGTAAMGIKSKIGVRDRLKRSVYNIMLGDGNGEDRTRIVINEDAHLGYEIEYDAEKMVVEDGLPQIYVLDGGIRYAIDERPLDDGRFALGMSFPESGTYTIRLREKHEGQTPLMLTDHQTGTCVDIATTDYSFSAQKGQTDSRFTLDMSGNGQTGIDLTSAPSSRGQGSACYDLSGRRVGSQTASHNLQLPKGLYIQADGRGGRKVILK